MDARANTKMAIIHIGCALIGIVAQTKTAIAITEKGKTMRLIDADALIDELGISDEDIIFEGMLEDAPTIDAVPIETICEMFGNEAPCNYGLFGVSVDDFMMSKCGKWCEDNCDKVPHTECWQKFFEAIEKWRKQND